MNTRGNNKRSQSQKPNTVTVSAEDIEKFQKMLDNFGNKYSAFEADYNNIRTCKQ